MKGASGQMIQAANILLGLPETTGLPLARDPAVSITAAKGFVAGGLACGIKESGAPDLALVATDDHAPVPAAAVFTSNLAQAAPVQISRAHLADGRAAAVVLSSGNANAATGEPGRRDARRMCELAGARARQATADVLVCSTGLIGIPMPMAALEAGIPKLCGALERRRRRPTRPRRSSPPTPCARKRRPRAGQRGRRRHGQGRGDALARDGHDARGAHHRRRGRRRGAATCARARGQRDLRLPQRRRLPVDQRHGDRARQRARRRGRRPTRSPPRSPRCAVRSPSRWRATPKARPSSSACASSARAPRPRRASRPARWPTASSCSARSTAATPTGAACSRSWVRAARSSIPKRSTSRTTASPCAATVSRARTTRLRSPRHMAGREIEVVCDLRLAHGEATVLTTDLSHAYIDENRRTS